MRISIATAVLFPAIFVVSCGPSSGIGDNPPAPAALRIHLAGSGSGAIRSSSPAFDCTGECTQTMQIGAALHLTAAPADGSQFIGWVAGCAGTAGCDLTINGDTDVVARFDLIPQPPPPPPPAPVTLTVDVQVNGRGTLTSTPAGIDCGQTCHATFTST